MHPDRPHVIRANFFIKEIFMDNICSYKKCLTCPIKTCWTGEVARTHGKDDYEAHLKMLDEAEENLNNEEFI